MTKQIPVLDRIDADEFYQDYIRENKPCLIRGGANGWPAVQRWDDDEYLARLAGRRTVPRTKSTREDLGFDHQSPIDDIKLNDFLQVYRESPENYLNDAQMPGIMVMDLGKHPTLEAFQRLEPCDRYRTMFFSAGDQLAPLHYDDEDNLYVVIFGEKEFTLFDISNFETMFPHDNEEFPDFSLVDTLSSTDRESGKTKGSLLTPEQIEKHKNTPSYTVSVKPGDILYIPAYWWHIVQTKGRSLAVSFVKLDRESQFKVFQKLLDNNVFPIDEAQQEEVRSRYGDHERTCKEFDEGTLPFDNLFALYASMMALFLHEKHNDGDMKKVRGMFASVNKRVSEVIEQRPYSHPILYLLVNFFRCSCSMFRVDE